MTDKYEKGNLNNFNLNSIGKFLNKFKEIIGDNTDRKIKIVLVIKEEIGVNIEVDTVKIKKNIITINKSPILKSEIFLHKKNILDKLSNYGFNFTDIR